MCGIIGYIGKKEAAPLLLQGLRRLEYRGYDSSGVAVITPPNPPLAGGGETTVLRCVRAVGKIDQLAEKMKNTQPQGTIGIAHTRWATHGGVTEENAHPHVVMDGKLAIVHNGIIENYRELKEQMTGVSFQSETDSEVLAHLIAQEYKQLTRNKPARHASQGDGGGEQGANAILRQAVEQALKHVRGTYGLVVMHADHPDMLVAARMGSPLVIGVGETEHYVASDASPILAHTKKVIFLDDGEVAEIHTDHVDIVTLKDTKVTKCVEEIAWDEQQAQKQGFDHFMLKEMNDQPTVFEDAIRGRYDLATGTAHLGGLNMSDEEVRSIRRIILIACGTASYAAMVGKFAFERLAGIPTDVEVASEFRYRDPIIDEHTLVFGVSQSGETADTIAALREAKRKGAVVRGIVNVVGSTIARETDGGTYIHAGPELAVASTKAYTNMIAIMMLYAIQFGRCRRLTQATGIRILTAMQEIPAKMHQIFAQSDAIKAIAQKYAHIRHCFFLGRGVNFPVALEGSLKLKEITYIHSEAYPGGELKHGPIALLNEQFPVIAVMTQDQLYEKMRSNVEEIRARKSPIILVATEGDARAAELADDVIYVPDTMELLEPLINTLPLQLLAYHTAVILGRDVDRPRNLAKSVTVE